MYPPDLRYSKDHEWIRMIGETGQIGITNYAQAQLGDVVFVDLPEVGRSFGRGEQFGSIESVKAVSDLFCPVSGEVVEVNAALTTQPELINLDAHVAWMITLKLKDLDELRNLLDASGYAGLLT